MSLAKRILKRFKREHRTKESARTPPPADKFLGTRPDEVAVVYQPKDQAEARRRVARMHALVGKPFLRMPPPEYWPDDIRRGKSLTTETPADDFVLSTAFDGTTPITIGAVEMVFNDALLADAISAGGKDGPLYEATVTGLERFVYALAQRLYRGATWDDPRPWERECIVCRQPKETCQHAQP